VENLRIASRDIARVPGLVGEYFTGDESACVAPSSDGSYRVWRDKNRKYSGGGERIVFMFVGRSEGGRRIFLDLYDIVNNRALLQLTVGDSDSEFGMLSFSDGSGTVELVRRLKNEYGLSLSKAESLITLRGLAGSVTSSQLLDVIKDSEIR
jgi:hypothetical protein